MKKFCTALAICLMLTNIMSLQVFATTNSESNVADLSQAEDGNDLYTITAHGQYALSAKDSISISIEWQGNGTYLVLLTKEDYSVEEINKLAQSGLLPIGSFENGVNQELAKKFSGIQMLLSVSNCNIIKETISALDTATYNLYTVAESDCQEVSGTITAGNEQISLV